MKAIQMTRPGAPDVLEYVDLPPPEPAPGQAVVRLSAIGVNFADIALRRGASACAMPLVPGVEAAGTVVAVGEDVTNLQVGDRVAYADGKHSYAEFAVQPAWRLTPLPEDIGFELAAAALEQGMAAHYLTHDCYRVRPDEVVLVHAGAGGVGQLLIQMARQLGAVVIATVSNEAKAVVAKACGADHVICYTAQDFEAETLRLTDGRGVDVVYDSVGRDTFAKGLRVLRNRGCMVSYGQAGGPPDALALDALDARGIFVTRPSLALYAHNQKEVTTRADAVFGALLADRLKIDITETFRLPDAAAAHCRLESRATTGKLLLIP